MPEIAINQAFVIVYYIIAGAMFFLLFDMLTFTQKIFGRPKFLIIAGDALFWIIFILVFFTMNYNLLNGEIKGYAILGTLLGALIYYLLRKRLRRKG